MRMDRATDEKTALQTLYRCFAMVAWCKGKYEGGMTKDIRMNHQ
jgi:hypothetical protein